MSLTSSGKIVVEGEVDLGIRIEISTSDRHGFSNNLALRSIFISDKGINRTRASSRWAGITEAWLGPLATWNTQRKIRRR